MLHCFCKFCTIVLLLISYSSNLQLVKLFFQPVGKEHSVALALYHNVHAFINEMRGRPVMLGI